MITYTRPRIVIGVFAGVEDLRDCVNALSARNNSAPSMLALAGSATVRQECDEALAGRIPVALANTAGSSAPSGMGGQESGSGEGWFASHIHGFAEWLPQNAAQIVQDCLSDSCLALFAIALDASQQSAAFAEMRGRVCRAIIMQDFPAAFGKGQ